MNTQGFFYDGRFVGRLFVKGSGKPTEILSKLNELAGFSPNEDIELFEVGLPGPVSVVL